MKLWEWSAILNMNRTTTRQFCSSVTSDYCSICYYKKSKRRRRILGNLAPCFCGGKRAAPILSRCSVVAAQSVHLVSAKPWRRRILCCTRRKTRHCLTLHPPLETCRCDVLIEISMPVLQNLWHYLWVIKAEILRFQAEKCKSLSKKGLPCLTIKINSANFTL